MNRLVLATAVLLGSLLGMTGTALAQDTTGTDPQLPEIAPQEIEIRGERRIDFPSLQRQPLRGFVTPPTIPTVPAARRPTVAPYRQDLADLPDSVPDVQGVSTRLSASPPPAQGRIDTGAGRYFHRFADGRLQFPFTTTESLSLHAAYEGTEGFEPFDASSVDTPYDRFDAGAEFVTQQSDVTFSVGAHGGFDEYTLYGAVPVVTALGEAEPGRTATSFGGDARLDVGGSTVSGHLGLDYERTGVESSFNPDDPVRFQEGRVTATAGLSFPIGPSPVDLDVTASTARQNSEVIDQRAFNVDAGGHALVVRQGDLRVDVGGRFLAFSAPTDPSNATTGDATFTFLAPVVDASWTPTPRLTLFARNRPGLDAHRLSDVQQMNPFLDDAPSLRPTLSTTNASAGVTVSTGPVRFTADAGFQYAPSFLYFVPAQDTPYRSGIFEAAYGSARIGRATGRAALQGVDRLQLSVGLTVRDGRLTAPDADIPNFAPLLVDAMASWSFGDGRGLLSMTGRVEGSRNATLDGTTELDPYASLDLEGSYDVTELLSLLARIDNLSSSSALERWDGYPQPPVTVSAGVRIRW